jgi:hypothetical protein
VANGNGKKKSNGGKMLKIGNFKEDLQMNQGQNKTK